MKFHCFLFLLAVVAGGSSGARIFAIMPMAIKSHANLVDPLVEELGRRGHQVTYFTTAEMDHPPGCNVTYTYLVKTSNHIKDIQSRFNNFKYKSVGQLLFALTMPIIPQSFSRKFLEEPIVQKLINSNEKYDLILGEVFMDEAVLGGFSHKFQAPFIALSPCHATVWANYMTGNPAPTAFVPDPMLPFNNRMTFFERLINTLYYMWTEMAHGMINLWIQDGLMREYFGQDLPHLRDIIKNASLVLVNQHSSVSYPRPCLPNVIEIGGFHVSTTPKELPKELKKYFDDSEHGVILFSLGSHLKSSQMSEEKINSLLKAFSQLKQTILWKFDGEIKDVPKNVHISKWLPQSDILAHPNLKLFITHGGLLSTTEAIHRGVPLVGIPVLGDQPANMKLVESIGCGVTLEYEDITTESVLAAVNKVSNNPKYKETAQLRSQLLKDTPMPPMETAMYWIEYVLRHNGAPHLRSAAQDLAWYQLYLLDVYAVLAIFAAVSLTLQFYIVRCLCRKLRGSKSKKVTPTKKHN